MQLPQGEKSASAVAPADLQALQRKLEEYERWFRRLDDHIRVLEGERRKLSALVNYTDAGILLVDRDGKVSWTNTVFHQRFDSARSRYGELLGQGCNQVLCRKASVCEACPAQKLFKSGTVAHHETTLVLQDRLLHVYVTAIPIHSPDGEIEQAIVMLQDLTDLQVLRRSEEALRISEQRFRSFFEQAGAGMVTLRADGSFIQVNPAFCSMLGYPEAELLRMNVTEVIHPDDRAEVDRQLAEARSGAQRVVETERRYLRRGGETVWCHTTEVWQVGEAKKPTHSVVLVQDVSKRKHAEQAFEQSRQRYQALVHSIDGIVWEADARASQFTFVSNQAQRILGFPVERWLNQPRFWRNHIHPEDLDHALGSLARAVEERRGHEIEYRIVAADGRSVWLRDTLSVVVEDGVVTRLRGLMVDVTERKSAEEALRKSEEQLRQSQKMEAVGRLAGGIAHDFNNLLTAITGYGHFLLRGLGAEHPLRREAVEITKAAERAGELTGQLLAFSRQQVLQPRVLDLNAVVADMETMLRRVIGEDIELVTSLDSRMSRIKADPFQLQQVILNLVVNARDAMPGGGKITLETADIDLKEESPARTADIEPGSYVTLAVSDTGIGMDEETRSRMFEPFFTTKEQGKGTGLGLSTVYGIVRQSGGYIWAETEPGKGSTFRVCLPRTALPLTDTQVRAESSLPDAYPGIERILLVEDDDSVRELAREILELNGYTVFEARNGVEALAFCEAGDEAIDLMVTDLVMPLMGGCDLVRKVGPLLPQLRFLYLSGYTDSAVMHQGLLEPGSSFLQKPFTPAALARKVREVLDLKPGADRPGPGVSAAESS